MPINAATFDIETSDLKGDFGIVLCACIKPAHGRMVTLRSDVMNTEWAIGRRSNDEQIVTTIRTELSKYDVLVAHNGTRFDVPFLNTRLMAHGLEPLRLKKIVDPVLIGRKWLALHSNRLDAMAEHFGLGHKTPVDSRIWRRAYLDGDIEAMDYIVAHCKKDVEILEGVADRVKVFSSAFDTKGSWY